MAGASSVAELSLCTFGWYSRSTDRRGRRSVQHFVALFDINQWYQVRDRPLLLTNTSEMHERLLYIT